ncbi:MAG: PEP-CTERM sorting domain-containing protein [Phycisphaerae bacterium]|jgi:hypothetical protein|nr:PEP-CTERM sorting domain-containing protein [Phycisphaerae bacterium]
MFKKITLIAILFVLAPGVPAVHADMIPLDKATQGEGNKGASFRPWTDASRTQTVDFVMTARTGIDETNPLVADATGLAGTVYIDKDGKGGKPRGTGVQTASGGGSKGISGGGGDRDEELIFTYDQPVYISGVTIRLGDIEFGAPGVVDKDDPVIFLQTVGSPTFNVTLTESDIFAAFSYIGDPGNKYGEVDFNSFITSAGLNQNAGLIAFSVRETNGHLYVNGVSSGGGNVVPEPATLAVLACGGMVLVRRRRRGKA